VLWIFALVPLLILPPVVSLVYAVLTLRKDLPSVRSSNLDWLIIISALNIFVSLTLWAKFHFAGAELFAALLHYLKYLKSFPDLLFHPSTLDRPPVRVIPL